MRLIKSISIQVLVLNALFMVTGSNAVAATCNLEQATNGGGYIQAIVNEPVSQDVDTQLRIEISESLSFVRLINSEISVEYGGFHGANPENLQFAVKSLVIKDTGLEQMGPSDFLGAGAGIGPIDSATVIFDGTDRKTVRMIWNRWNVGSQTEVPTSKIIRDITIYANQKFLKVDFVDMQWAANIADKLLPGGTSTGVHIAHGGEDWARGYLTHNEPPHGLFYSRYGDDGVFDPVDGGPLNYNGHFITAVYNASNGQGFGRVMPIADTHVIKLLFSPDARRGLEFQNYPFLNPHPPFSGWMYVFTSGAAEAMTVGRQLVDRVEQEENSAIECGTPIDVSAMAYSGWGFTDWSGDLTGTQNPVLYPLDTDASITANFEMLPGLYGEDFEGYTAGDQPAFWLDTGPFSSLTEDDALFSIQADAGGSYLATDSTATNIHSHLDGVALANGYEYTGRLRMTHQQAGIGVTVFSQYPAAAAYYRLRQFGSGEFHLTAEGSSFTGGMTQSTVIARANTWFRFRIRIEDTGSQTEIKANVWEDGREEPAGWQINAFDSGPSRLTGGTVGLWTYSSGSKHFDELEVRSLIPAVPTIPLTTAVIGNGTVARNPDQPQYAFGDRISVTALPDSGWLFTGWSGDAETLRNPLELSISTPLALTANFDEITLHDLTRAVTGLGTIVAQPDQASYLSNESVTLTAVPAAGWGFLSWEGALTGSENPATLPMNQDRSVTANFAPLVPIYEESFDGLIIGDDPGGWLDTGPFSSLTEQDNFEVQDDGGNQSFCTSSTATNIHSHQTDLVIPGSGYQYSGRMRINAPRGGIGVTFFSQFPGSTDYYRLRRYGSGSFHLTPTGIDGLNGLVVSNVTPQPGVWYRFLIEVDALSDRTEVKARIWRESDPEPPDWQVNATDTSADRLTGGHAGLWSFSDGSKCWDDLSVLALQTGPLVTYTLGTSVIGNGTVMLSEDLPEYNAGVTLTLEAIPDPGWRFVGWQGDLTGVENPTGLQMLDNHNVTAVFEEIVQHTVSVSPTGQGTILANPDQPTYDSGTTLSLTATPDVGWLFNGWSGDVISNDNPLNLTVLSDLSINAEFIPITQHPVAVTVDGQGTVARSPDQPTYDLGSTVTVTATPAPGWQFSDWSGAATGNTNPLVLTIAGDVALTATFVEATGQYIDDFQSYGSGQNPTGWMDTDANNSLSANDSLFSTATEGANTYFATSSGATNIHSHLVGEPVPLGGYRYSGRMRITNSAGGIGVTFFSQYPTQSTYYRLRRYGSNAFHFSPVGTTVSGDTDTGVVPVANQWYQFVIEVEDDGIQTNLRAKVWVDGQTEPVDWQADAIDSSPTRLVAGTVGVWGYHNGGKQFDDITIDPLGPPPPPPTDLVLSLTTSGNGSVAIQPDKPQYDFGELVQITATPDAGWAFSSWSGDAGGNDNPLNIVMTGDLSINAAFIDPTAQWSESFDSYNIGDDPADWIDTASGNSTQAADKHAVADQGGNLVFETQSTETNIHSHYSGLLPSTSSYELTGRMQMTSGSSGIGVTFFSQFPATAAYYRLRRYGSNSFHISPLGTSVSGDTDTGVQPASNTWYRFRIQVVDTGVQTEIRANVWEDGMTEPAGWQADAVDSSPTRLTGGTIGVWSFSSGTKRWDDFQVTPF